MKLEGDETLAHQISIIENVVINCAQNFLPHYFTGVQLVGKFSLLS